MTQNSPSPEKQKRAFEGVWIPKEVWLSKELTLQEKVFYVEICSLDNEDGCFALNEYFAKFFGISKTRVSKVISSLVEKRFITSEIHYKKGTKQIVKRVLKKSSIGYRTKVQEGIEENDHTPIEQKFIDNSTDTNNTNNSTKDITVFLENESFSIHGKMIIDLHCEWFKKNNEGIPPKIDGAQGKAAKQLYEYLIEVVKSKYEGVTEVEMPLKIKEILCYIFHNWGRLDKFNQKQVKITQINSNITNIMNDLKNSANVTSSSGKIGRQTHDEFKNTFESFLRN